MYDRRGGFVEGGGWTGRNLVFRIRRRLMRGGGLGSGSRSGRLRERFLPSSFQRSGNHDLGIESSGFQDSCTSLFQLTPLLVHKGET